MGTNVIKESFKPTWETLGDFFDKTDQTGWWQRNNDGVTYSHTQKDGIVSNEGFPAKVRFSSSEETAKCIEEWWVLNGLDHRIDGPSYIKFLYGSNPIFEFKRHGVFHRENDLPATSNGNFYLFGMRHKVTGPISLSKKESNWYYLGYVLDPKSFEENLKRSFARKLTLEMCAPEEKEDYVEIFNTWENNLKWAKYKPKNKCSLDMDQNLQWLYDNRPDLNFTTEYSAREYIAQAILRSWYNVPQIDIDLLLEFGLCGKLAYYIVRAWFPTDVSIKELVKTTIGRNKLDYYSFDYDETTRVCEIIKSRFEQGIYKV